VADDRIVQQQRVFCRLVAGHAGKIIGDLSTDLRALHLKTQQERANEKTLRGRLFWPTLDALGSVDSFRSSGIGHVPSRFAFHRGERGASDGKKIRTGGGCFFEF
jgi:hypothetical protein